MGNIFYNLPIERVDIFLIVFLFFEENLSLPTSHKIEENRNKIIRVIFKNKNDKKAMPGVRQILTLPKKSLIYV